MFANLTDQLLTISAGRGGQLAAAVLATIAVLFIANQSLQIYRTASYSPAVETVNAVTVQAANQEYNATDITERNLFGSYAVSPEQLKGSNLPTTTLEITLRGVFTSSNPNQANAIIQRPDGVTRSYKVNGVVFGKTRLHAVFNDRIVLSTNGELETLYFPEPSEASTANDLPPAVQEMVQQNMSAEEIQQASQQLKSSAMTPEQRKQLIRQRLFDLRNRARENKQ